MKKLIFVILFALPLSLFAQTAKIKIEVDRTVGKIDPNIYGVFMEPIHFSGSRMGLPDSTGFNTLYGTLYNPSSPLSNKDGFIKNYIEAMNTSIKQLKTLPVSTRLLKETHRILMKGVRDRKSVV